MKEEIGLDILEKDLNLINIVKNSKIHTYIYNYIINIVDLGNNYILQKKEVSEVKYFSIDKLEKEVKNKNPEFTFSNWEENIFKEQIDYLKNQS